MKTKPIVGERVMVYQDPITQQQPEGFADIVSIGRVDDYFEVQFVGDVYSDTYWRFIH